MIAFGEEKGRLFWKSQLFGESAIILGELIFWGIGNHFGRVNFLGVAITFCGDEIGGGDRFLEGEEENGDRFRLTWNSAQAHY